MAVATSVHYSIFVRAQRCTMYVNRFYVTDCTHTCSELQFCRGVATLITQSEHVACTTQLCTCCQMLSAVSCSSKIAFGCFALRPCLAQLPVHSALA